MRMYFAIALTLLIPGPAIKGHIKEKTNPSETTYGAQSCIKTEVVQIIKSDSETPEQITRSKAAKSENQAHDWLYTAYLISAAISAVLTGLIAYIMWIQISSFRQAERAWMVGKPRFKNLDEPPEGQAYYVIYVCIFRNTGRTPAKILEAGLSIRTIDSLEKLPQKPEYEIYEKTPCNKVPVTPKDSFARTTLLNGVLTNKEYAAIKTHRLFLYGYGFVKYLDAFGCRRETNFCHRYVVPKGEPMIEGFQRYYEAPSEYNKAT